MSVNEDDKEERALGLCTPVMRRSRSIPSSSSIFKDRPCNRMVGD